MSNQELACVLAAIVIADEGQECTAANIKAVCDAAGVKVEGIWPLLFANYLEGKNVMDLLTSLGSAAAAPAAAGGAPAGAAAAAAEPAKKEESSDDEIIGAGGMFGDDSSSEEESSSD
ncbi:Ribosomal protein P1B [Giardia muris]|uniref:Ribosomal protein P1B n=1 Tax=Giardia muris TaxID=5742 RepID=A0A4Z1SPV3_GIAMU|nr:Ribosomal protein P1B [Giardia muris]|eukprot:TNJ27864.1 Ribosomal protein P1B [Giardia muris]